VLASRSPFFRALLFSGVSRHLSAEPLDLMWFLSQFAEAKQKSVRRKRSSHAPARVCLAQSFVSVPEIEPALFALMLKNMYTDEVSALPRFAPVCILLAICHGAASLP
jgi:hypothetical protein